MDFDFSEEQEQLRDAVRKWVDKAYHFERHRHITKEGGFSRQAYAEIAGLGLCGLYVSEDHGGLGMGPIEGMIAMEELGRGIVHEPLTQTLISSGVLGAYGSQELKSRWLPGLADGSALLVLAQQETQARYRLAECRTKAAQLAGGWLVSGAKSLVPVGDLADAFLVPAMVGERLGLFLVERRAEGVSTRAYGTQDGGRAAELKLERTPAELITLDGQAALEQAIDIGIAALCAEAVGVMDKTLAITVEYMNTRKQFGVTIASFQALRHRMADVKMQLELARSMSYYASLKLNAPAEERRRALARAKVQIGASMRFVGQSAVQLHGGIGVADEYLVSHYFKKLTSLEMTFGDSLHHLGEVSDRMLDSAGVFA